MQKRENMKHLSSSEYLMELGRRLKEHSTDRVIGKQAKREIDIAGRLLQQIGRERKQEKESHHFNLGE
jgi:hypothetical protein